ncbi:Aldose 1-epimerase precursor [Roseivivax jejudonensis]|uniref:Aldose 1-epimerase n=1 Tax=Roseivivax jejudonensis TaxID=1529041 RepID=A0A1X6YQX9_9RHOB|nr:aldose epimerase family protein [Roseivivax jejudonensis]SLN28686.1 Aldose 1-epimerase precursor [Roseivivax jejudonensis]
MTGQLVGQTPEGREIHEIGIASDALEARILTYGASIRDLRLAGVAHPLVLGFDDAADYAREMPYMGAIVGRVANRIAEGTAEIAGETCRFDLNERGMQTLHGGSDGAGRRVWRIEETGPAHAVLADTLPDGHMGFPGALEVQVRYTIEGGTLTVEITATTDAPTLCAFAPHCYFNLSGAETIDDHLLEIAAETFQPVDARKIPDGPPISVADTGFDLREPATPPWGVDHNYCLAEIRRAPRDVLTLRAGGVEMRIETSEPGMQVYDGGGLDITGARGLGGRNYGARGGLALEPQAWVDAANQGMRAQVDLFPGEPYRALSRFAFARV